MAKYLVCQKWIIDIPAEYIASAEFVYRRAAYLWYVGHRPEYVARQAWCLDYILRYLAIGSVDSVFEYFGGAGIASTILHHRIQPSWHGANDADDKCIKCLANLEYIDQVTGFNAWSIQHVPIDMFRRSADLVHLDFSRFSVHAWNDPNNAECGRLLDMVMADDNKYVILTDTSAGRLHINASVYGQIMNDGQPIYTVGEYVTCLSRMWSRLYGRQVQAAVYHRRYNSGACTILFSSDPEPEHIPIIEAPPVAHLSFQSRTVTRRG